MSSSYELPAEKRQITTTILILATVTTSDRYIQIHPSPELNADTYSIISMLAHQRFTYIYYIDFVKIWFLYYFLL